ncbi:MAG: phosphate ABC transporter permease PstA [Calditrichaeota bacterium]|nr:phosphate ABC transporter permease PstA [Calditrichota bacterium]RQW01925.1 MAG: phosphate ABC transporter permease PstA [Calditrichota bacterium]
MADRISYFRQKGDPYILLTSLGLVISLGMVAFMIWLILSKGLGFFWPSDLIQVNLKNGNSHLGELRARETAYIAEQEKEQIQLKIGNREILGRDFIWIDQANIQSESWPDDAVTFERLENGNFYGFIQSLHVGEETLTGESATLFRKCQVYQDSARNLRENILDMENDLTNLIEPLTRLHREISLLKIEWGNLSDQDKKELEKLEMRAAELQEQLTPRYEELSAELQALITRNRGIFVSVKAATGQIQEIQLSRVVRFYRPNRMNILAKSGTYIAKLWEFLTAKPRESNTEGGVFPAIFGTVMMVMLMSIAVVPFGVLAALYLNEYARQGKIIRLIRLSVNNLAGVPSIVFGIFGLGFFIYMVGGTIDQILFSDTLPEPTFGTGGILWASLTLALLTLPVVVVATEEGILAVPKANKEGALALGSTKWQMIRKIVLPNAMPGILTGLILAISRGAGEVAPLMITGVVKLAPSLPLDSAFPFLHLDRKFMHLGFHIYDVGFQSPNVEAAKPMVYATALLLILIVLALNLLAIYLRNRLRKKYKSSVF